MTVPTPVGTDPISLEQRHSSHNYHPLPVVVAEAQGAWVTDIHGKRYIDCLSGYSALNFGHRNPRLLAAAHRQLDRVTLTSRAFHNDQLGPFSAELAALAGQDAIVPMNTGAEAVETAIKLARKWGYAVKGVPQERATIIVADGNFHGRTISIVSFSNDLAARRDFGPFTPGFRSVPFGDAAALAEAIDDTCVAVLLEPIQGEAGVIIPPDTYLREVRRLCDDRNLLFIADEIQSGLGRTGRTFACDHEGVRPDLFTLGKALGGGIAPVSAVVGGWEVLGTLRPGEHGSTFGGNPLSAAIGREVVAILAEGELQARAAELGILLEKRLAELVGRGIVDYRVRGLWADIDVAPQAGTGRQVCERLANHGVLAKDTHGSTIRLSPPLVIDEDDLAHALYVLADQLDG